MVRIALIDECDQGEEIGRLLVKAGYDVSYLPDGEGLDGGAELVLHVTSPISESGIKALAVASDIVEEELRQHEEALLRESQKMEAIARLAGGIAHDFNNILSVISICTDEIIDTMNPGGIARACLEDIRHAVERGSSVTRDLLAFSRRDVRDPRLVDFNETVASCRRMVERIVGDDIRIETSLAAIDASVRIDSSQWSSVFVNLALNARTAMPRGGTLRLRTRDVTIDPQERGRNKPKGKYVELEVADTGCGMSDEVLARIFEPFFTTKGLGKGTGLGLSVVFGVVEQSGGWIEVTSGIGSGTTFRIYVPSSLEERRADSHPRPVPPERRQTSVLVVEDEEPVRRVTVRALERHGYCVFQAGTAEDALAMTRTIGPIDLLVTDIVLPGMNGRRLAEALTRADPELAVLYTSGYTDDEIVRKGAANSEVFYLQKPYSTKLLLRRVEEVLATMSKPAFSM
jgi:signal transduction histidine kinase/ActR/RegA family two-component response regulator